MNLPDWRLDPPEDGPEVTTDHDLYMQSVMEDEECPHDWEHLVEGDRAYGEICTHCGEKHEWKRGVA